MLPLLLFLACNHECDGPYARCEGNVAASCGFRWTSELTGYWSLRREECGERFCQALAGEVFCALDADEDPICPVELAEVSNASRCHVGDLVTWKWCRRVAAEPCAGTCADVASPGFDPVCTTSAVCSPFDAPDPLCEQGVFTSCADDRTIVYCACRWRASAHACENPGPSCTFVPVDGARPQGACR
jgi:hypothetical protein